MSLPVRPPWPWLLGWLFAPGGNLHEQCAVAALDKTKDQLK